jgi:hypothetical protein
MLSMHISIEQTRPAIFIHFTVFHNFIILCHKKTTKTSQYFLIEYVDETEFFN